MGLDRPLHFPSTSEYPSDRKRATSRHLPTPSKHFVSTFEQFAKTTNPVHPTLLHFFLLPSHISHLPSVISHPPSVISFIIPAHNEEALLGRTLAALHRWAPATGEPYE